MPEMGVPTKLGKCVTEQNGVTRFPKGLCSREGNARDILVLVIRISIWNQMHIANVPWNNESVNVH